MLRKRQQKITHCWTQVTDERFSDVRTRHIKEQCTSVTDVFGQRSGCAGWLAVRSGGHRRLTTRYQGKEDWCKDQQLPAFKVWSINFQHDVLTLQCLRGLAPDFVIGRQGRGPHVSSSILGVSSRFWMLSCSNSGTTLAISVCNEVH